MRKKNHNNRLLFSAIVLMVLAVAGLYTISNLGKWLIVEDSVPESLDVIFTPSGETSRITYSKYLFRKNRNAIWLISYPGKKIMSSFARDSLDTTRIYITDTCMNTRSEMAFLKGWMESHGKSAGKSRQKVAIVSAWYHMKRIQLIIKAQIKDRKYKIYMLPVEPESPDIYGKWWKNRNVRSIVLREWEKIILYRFMNLYPPTMGFL
jgi:uncharacterized SAM-binding protein YcdF (DUF218 family)